MVREHILCLCRPAVTVKVAVHAADALIKVVLAVKVLGEVLHKEI